MREALVELIRENARLQCLCSGQLAQLEATLGSLREAVLIINGDNAILLANKAFMAIFPQANATPGRRIERVLHSVAFLEYVGAVRSGGAPARQEIKIISAGDSFEEGARWLEISGAKIPAADGTAGTWALFVLHDVTHQKKLEAVRKEFVANVSHELRTPLSVITSAAETLADGHAAMPIADRARFLGIIQRHAVRLASLLNDLLTLSRLESHDSGLHLERVSLQVLVSSFLEDCRARPAAAGRQITADIASNIGELWLDPLKIVQVLENLFDNALKYTPAGSAISLTACLHNQAPDKVELRVQDNGPGIPAADLPHIFERFYRVDKGRSRETGGTGLGLSIVKHIVQLHGGHATASSNHGKGTTFTLVFPIGGGNSLPTAP